MFQKKVYFIFWYLKIFNEKLQLKLHENRIVQFVKRFMWCMYFRNVYNTLLCSVVWYCFVMNEDKYHIVSMWFSNASF